MKLRLGFLCVGVWVLLSALIGLSPDVRASSDVNLIVEEIQKAVSDAVSLEDKDEREGTLTLLALGLARVGRFDVALEVIKHHDNDKLRQANRDEIWRVTARRLAWQGNIEAATRCANRIEGKFSRADAWLAVARATRRTGDSDAVLEILKRASPAVHATQSPLALAYLAYLFAQNGDSAIARQLFARALALPSAKVLEYNEAYDSQRAIVAYFQAKCAWNREAIGTAGTELSNLQQTKPLLIARREWSLLHKFSDGLSPRQSIELLLELSAAQLATGVGQESRATLAMARTRFTTLPLADQDLATVFALRLRLALLEIAHGETEMGWKRFETLSNSPRFNSKWEFAFYYSLIATQNRAVLKLSPQQYEEYEQKAIAAWLRQAMTVETIFPFSLLDVARAQIGRGDKEAARKTLQLEKTRIRECLVPGSKGANIIPGFISLVPYELIALARCEREVGMRYQVTLEQARSYWRSRSKDLQGIDLYADALLRQGFFDEADRVLNAIGYKNLTPEFGLLPARANDYAVAKGIPTGVEWARKFPSVSMRGMALFRIAALLGRIEPEIDEITLRGSNAENLKVDGWPRSNYRPVFDLTAFTIHE